MSLTGIRRLPLYYGGALWILSGNPEFGFYRPRG
jgi:hypothetical protein